MTAEIFDSRGSLLPPDELDKIRAEIPAAKLGAYDALVSAARENALAETEAAESRKAIDMAMVDLSNAQAELLRHRPNLSHTDLVRQMHQQAAIDAGHRS
jgi:hypothetical protein